MGSAIECFANAGAVVVPRSRFAPVKACNDLFVLRSDAYTVTPASTVELAAEKVGAKGRVCASLSCLLKAKTWLATRNFGCLALCLALKSPCLPRIKSMI